MADPRELLARMGAPSPDDDPKTPWWRKPLDFLTREHTAQSLGLMDPGVSLPMSGGYQRGAPLIDAAAQGQPYTPFTQGAGFMARGLADYAWNHPVEFGIDMTPVAGDIKAGVYDLPRSQSGLERGLILASLIPGVPNLVKAGRHGRMLSRLARLRSVGLDASVLAREAVQRGLPEEMGGFGGFTFRMTGEGLEDLGGQPFIAVAEHAGDDLVVPLPDGQMTEEVESQILDLIEANEDLLKGDRNAIGGWVRVKPDGSQELVIDIARLYPSNAQGYERAMAHGAKMDQDAAFDLSNFREYPIMETPSRPLTAMPEGDAAQEMRAFRPEPNPYRDARANAERRGNVLDTKAHWMERMDELRAGMSPQELEYFERNLVRKTGDLKGTMTELADNTVDAYARLPEPRTFASAILAGASQRGWYRQSGQTIAQVFGNDAPRFTYLLAATSPSKSVQENLNIATNVWKNWVDAGRPSNVTREQIASWWPERLNGEQMKTLDADIGNALTALNEAESTFAPGNLQGLIDPDNPFTKRFLSGGKVDPFAANLLGEVERITNDTHMARGYGTDPGNVTTNARVLAQNAMVRNAGREVERLTGGAISGREAQEMSWAFIRAITMAGGSDGRHLERALQDYMADLSSASPTGPYREVMTRINDSVPFSDLLSRPEYAERLRSIGLEPPQFQQLQGMGLGPEQLRGMVREGDLNDIIQRIQAAKDEKPFYELALPWALPAGGAAGAGILRATNQQQQGG